jgi:hypothetical protein
VQFVFWLGGDAEIEVDTVFFEEIVEAAHPDVADHDVGGLEDGAHGVGVVEGEHDRSSAQGVGLARTEACDVADDLLVFAVEKLLLRG